jgi:hypothetical protein
MYDPKTVEKIVGAVVRVGKIIPNKFELFGDATKCVTTKRESPALHQIQGVECSMTIYTPKQTC